MPGDNRLFVLFVPFLVGLLVLGLLGIGGGVIIGKINRSQQAARPTLTPTLPAIAQATPTFTPSATRLPTNTLEPTLTPTEVVQDTPTSTGAETATPTWTPMPSATPIPSATHVEEETTPRPTSTHTPLVTEEVAETETVEMTVTPIPGTPQAPITPTPHPPTVEIAEGTESSDNVALGTLAVEEPTAAPTPTIISTQGLIEDIKDNTATLVGIIVTLIGVILIFIVGILTFAFAVPAALTSWKKYRSKGNINRVNGR